MRKTLLLLLALVIALSCTDALAQKRKKSSKKRTVTTAVQPKKTVNTTGSKQLMNAKDGYQWFLVKKGNLYGAQDKSGKTIIPAEYDTIYCCSDDRYNDNMSIIWEYRRDKYRYGEGAASVRYFTAQKNGYKALFYPDGRCPISVDRKYNSITIDITGNKAYILVSRDSKCGLCDMDGVEVISPLYLTISIGTAKDKEDDLKDINYYYIKIMDGKNPDTDYTYHIADLDGNIVKKDYLIIFYYVNKGYYAEKKDSDEETKISINQNSRYNFNHISGVTSFFGSILPAPIDNNSGRSEGSKVTTDRPRPSNPQPSKQQVQVWKPCQYCGSTGLCSYCGGWGVKRYTNSVFTCPGCNGNGKCLQCGGMKGHYEYEWR